MDPAFERVTRRKARRIVRRRRRAALARGAVALAIMLAVIPLVSLEAATGPWRSVDLLGDYDALARLRGMCHDGDLLGGGYCSALGLGQREGELRIAAAGDGLRFHPQRRGDRTTVKAATGLPFFAPDWGDGLARLNHRLPLGGSPPPWLARIDEAGAGGGAFFLFDDDGGGGGGGGNNPPGGNPPGNPGGPGTPVPEPGAVLLFALGLAALRSVSRRG